MSAVQDLDFLPGFALEGFPNRDSTAYRDLYGLHNANTVFRGTLRFRGFCKTIKTLQCIGLTNPDPHPSLHPNGPDITWRALICNLVNLTNDMFYENLKRKLGEMLNSEDDVQAIEDLGLLQEDLVLKLNTPIDTLTHYLSKKLCFDQNERDLVILRHDVGILWPDNRREERGINLVLYGDKRYSAMARTVGYPTAITVKMILDGEIQQRGVVLPFTPDIYRPILNRLKAEGIEFVETSKWVT